MIKMIVTSFYNTLIDEEDAIPTSTMIEFDEFKNKGVPLTILNNRLLDEVLYYNHSYPFIRYVIGLNGSILYDVEAEQILLKKKLNDEVIQKVEEVFSRYPILYYGENEVSNERVNDVYKIEIKLPKKNHKILNMCKEIGANCSILEINKEYYLEISPSTFKDSLERLLRYLGIDSKDVLGIVGNDSDLSLISYLDNCYVVSNASRTLKSKTRKRTKSNTSKGVEELLKKIKK